MKSGTYVRKIPETTCLWERKDRDEKQNKDGRKVKPFKTMKKQGRNPKTAHNPGRKTFRGDDGAPKQSNLTDSPKRLCWESVQ